jgi:hypothetical protein
VPEPYGGADKPLSDAALDTKYLGLATPQIGEDKARSSLAMAWDLAKLADVRALAEAVAG